MNALCVIPTQKNCILGSLARHDLELLEPHLEPVTLKFRQRLQIANRKIVSVYFIDAGLASVVALEGSEHRRAEIGVVGREGMTGVAVTFGVDRSPCETFVQIEGHGRCIGASMLRALIARSPSLLSCLLRYAHVFAVQIGQTALANAQGKISERLARWLLMAHDRLPGDGLHLTHEFLSITLGVRRAGVTTALHELESSGLISTKRGCVTVLDRDGLEESTGGLYGMPEAEFERLFPNSS
jgi:CRP-like cAMP-binding protein